MQERKRSHESGEATIAVDPKASILLQLKPYKGSDIKQLMQKENILMHHCENNHCLQRYSLVIIILNIEGLMWD